jgi:hypothetical protein
MLLKTIPSIDLKAHRKLRLSDVLRPANGDDSKKIHKRDTPFLIVGEDDLGLLAGGNASAQLEDGGIVSMRTLYAARDAAVGALQETTIASKDFGGCIAG